ncbi:MAG: hypothetical protein KKB50_05090 [Planctomycetes bacterium]|nr:hypothetical protein [Planctomycetota bacterium]
MLRWILMIVCSSALPSLLQEKPQSSVQPSATQATTKPAPPPTLRKPEQAQILEQLIRERDRPEPILPQSERAEGLVSDNGVGPSEAGGLLLDGTTLVERPGRFVRLGDRAEFVFRPRTGEDRTVRMEILENRLLEAMEAEVEKGTTEFVISAEVTRYQGRNYLLLRKLLKRVGHGNLGP